MADAQPAAAPWEDPEILQTYLLAVPPTKPLARGGPAKMIIDLLSDPAFQLK
jgi:hypothetical protein